MATTKSASGPKRSYAYAVITAGVVALLVVIGFAYIAVLQNYRQSANDPQIEIASSLATRLSGGAAPDTILVANDTKVNPSTSLSTFVVVANSNGTVTASSLDMGGSTPMPPQGVLNSAGIDHQNRVTWQPQNGTRIALVVQKYTYASESGYVLVGRSLKEVDARTTTLAWMAGAAALVVSLLGVFVCAVCGRRQ